MKDGALSLRSTGPVSRTPLADVRGLEDLNPSRDRQEAVVSFETGSCTSRETRIVSAANVDGEPSPVKVWEALVLGAILLLLLFVLALRAWRVGLTFDEPGHLLTAQLFWRGEDRLRPRDLPPLIKLVGGWVPDAIGFRLPDHHSENWEVLGEYNAAQTILQRMSADQIQRLFFFSRLPLIIFPLLSAALLWWWARQIFTPIVGLLVAAGFALEPNMLGHGALFKNDLAATFVYTLFWYRTWVYWQYPAYRSAAWLGAVTALAVLSKLSMLVLAPVAVAILLARYLTRRPVRIRPLAGSLAIVLLVAYVVVAAGTQFEVRRLTQADLAAVENDARFPPVLTRASQILRFVPAPIPIWEGAASIVRYNANSSWVYLLGRKIDYGHPLYFVCALWYKVPVPLQVLLFAGLLLECTAVFKKTFDPVRLFWIAPPFLYIALASASSLQLGIRLVLPALPTGLLICATAIHWLNRGRWRIVLCVLYGVLAVRTAQGYPYYISFFNLWTGSPLDGLHYLADSNIDWGQNLRDLKKVTDSLGIRKLKLSYFGADNPWAYYSDRELEMIVPPWNDQLATGMEYRPEPGYYAISVNLLPGHMFDTKYRDYYRVFREATPIGRAGYSILLYKVELPVAASL